MIDSASALTPLYVRSRPQGSGSGYRLYAGRLLGGVVLEERVVDLLGDEALQTADDVFFDSPCAVRRAR